jgi:molybdate transport system substrate-binding protein
MVAGGSGAGEQDARPVTVYAAASLSKVLEELGGSYQRATGHSVVFSYASSATLARQIESGAQADIFFPADTEWMAYLQARQLINAASRSDLLGNALVLIAPADSPLRLRIAPHFALAAALAGGRLAIGDPESVPAGRYARAALVALGVWPSVSSRLVRADNVRAALMFVARGEAPVGIVYRSDALGEGQVRVLDTFAPHLHPPIIYPVALTAAADPAAQRFLDFLRSAAASRVFLRYGFSLCSAPPATS